MKAQQAGTIGIGGDLTVNRLGAAASLELTPDDVAEISDAHR